jgi:hypothetical protein
MDMKLLSAAAVFLCIVTFRIAAASVVRQGSQAVAGGIVINGQALSSGGTSDTGILKKEMRELADFHQIDISNFAGKVHVRFGKENVVFVSADSSVVPLIKTEVTGQVLKIGVKKNISTTRPVKLDVQAKNISSLLADGAANVMIEDVNNKNFSLDVSGAASVTAQGNVKKMTVFISEAGEFHGKKLLSEEAVISVQDSGMAAVYVKKKMTANASDAGHVAYTGHPVIISETTGAGKVYAAKE